MKYWKSIFCVLIIAIIMRWMHWVLLSLQMDSCLVFWVSTTTIPLMFFPIYGQYSITKPQKTKIKIDRKTLSALQD